MFYFALCVALEPTTRHDLFNGSEHKAIGIDGLMLRWRWALSLHLNKSLWETLESRRLEKIEPEDLRGTRWRSIDKSSLASSIEHLVVSQNICLYLAKGLKHLVMGIGTSSEMHSLLFIVHPDKCFHSQHNRKKRSPLRSETLFIVFEKRELLLTSRACIGIRPKAA